jgi:hypothetical protein
LALLIYYDQMEKNIKKRRRREKRESGVGESAERGDKG